MKHCLSVLAASCAVLLVLAGGCTDVTTTQKVGGFGDAQATPAVTTPVPGSPEGGISAGTADTIEKMRTGNIYGMCYPACVNSKEKSAEDCDKACCMAQCQPKTGDETKRCAAICGMELK